MTPGEYTQALRSLSDPAYASFQAKLIPTVPREKILGVRIPAIRRLAKTLKTEGGRESFLAALPHTYYDEDNLHACLLMEERDVSRLLPRLEAFLPHIDNWATCDMMTPACFRGQEEALLPSVEAWLSSPHVYTCRFGIGVLMKFCLDEHFSPAYPARVAKISTGDYYLETMVAWYFATALGKRFQEILPYLTEKRLAPSVHRRTIRKACESFRLSDEEKQILRSCRV